MRLFCYIMTHDVGFAPNPFGKTLTLATCKPGIRLTKNIDDWVAGFSGKILSKKSGIESNRLIYLMRIGEKIPIRKYFNHPNFQNKIPDQNSKDQNRLLGDNIYRPLNKNAKNPDEFKKIESPHHKKNSEIEKDISGEYILVASEFYYFGKDAIDIPNSIRPKIPHGPARYGYKSDEKIAKEFVDFIRKNYQSGLNNHLPSEWDRNFPISSCESC